MEKGRTLNDAVQQSWQSRLFLRAGMENIKVFRIRDVSRIWKLTLIFIANVVVGIISTIATTNFTLRRGLQTTALLTRGEGYI